VKYVLPHAPHVYKIHIAAVQIRAQSTVQKHRSISVFASRALKMLNPPLLRFFAWAVAYQVCALEPDYCGGAAVVCTM